MRLLPLVPLVLLAGCAVTVEPVSVSAPEAQTVVAPPATAAPPKTGFTIVAGGDVLIHPALTEQATADGGGSRDYRPLLAGIEAVVSGADLGICHLEVPIATAAGPFRGYPLFSAPPEVVPALAATGFDHCSTASNHTLDQGVKGMTSTLDALDAAKITHTGSARSQADAATPLVREVNGTKVGLLSYTFALNKGTAHPPGQPWTANILDPKAVLAEAKRARQAGAEVVIASLHWGTEGKHEPTAEQQRVARQLLADPSIDLIIGHHAHVVQPFEKVGTKWVTYGLGNMVAKHEEPKGVTEEGVLARFRFTKTAGTWTVDTAEYIPTLVDLGPPIRLVDLTAAPDLDAKRRDQALDRTTGVVMSRGAGSHGLTRPGR